MPKAGGAYADTKVSISNSQEALRKLIYAHRGSGVSFISFPPREGFEAIVTIGSDPYRIRIMATCADVSKDRQGISRSTTAAVRAREQEERRVWRVLYWHLKAVFDAADAGVIDVRDVIMPYVVMADGKTVSDHIKPRMSGLLTAGTLSLEA